MTDTRTFLSQPFLRLVAVCSLPLILTPLIEYLAVARYGSAVFLTAELVFILPFLITLPTVVIAPFFLFFRRFRFLATRSLVASVAFMLAVVIGMLLGKGIRKAAFQSLAERSLPLVQAILSYELRHGSPPPDLAALVPGFIPSVPGTGMGGYPSYEYHTGEEASRYDGNPWVLIVFTPSGGINFDTFMYFPLQNYPKSGYGGWLEPVLDWAYVHE